MKPDTKYLPRLLLAGLLLAYCALTLTHLSVFPPVGEDEPWIAATSYKLAERGVYGSDLFTGFHGLEQHDFRHLPVFVLLQAGVFELAGVGVFQMRLVPVAAGFALLLLTFLVGCQLGDERIGLLAAALLLSLRLAGGDRYSGIPLLDIATVARYDILVPVFGLAAFWVFNRAGKHGGIWAYFVSGLLVGVASLSHLYGVFWLPALAMVLLWQRGWRVVRQREPYLLLLGFVLPWLPWLAFISTDWADYSNQMRITADRFDLLNPSFYLDNLAREHTRWHLYLGFRSPGSWLRPGVLAMLLGLPLAIALSLGRAGKPRALAIVLGLQAFLFALLLKVKSYNYGIALWPLALLALAYFGFWLWDRWGRWARGLLLLFLILILVEGGARMSHRQTQARRTTPYAAFEASIAAHIPPGSLVLGLQHYWLGLRQYRYRTWLLPIWWTDPRFCDKTLALDEALVEVAPDVILVDRHMGDYFASLANPDHPRHEHLGQFELFLDNNRAVLTSRLQDPTYGPMRIYRLNPVVTGR